MFVDVAKITIKSGNGGNGAVSFLREKYVASGGPDGGDGGRGGSIIFVADDNLSTLMDFKYHRKYKAKNGDDGGAQQCSGRAAPDLVIRVPRGTLIKEQETGLLLADISADEPVVIAKGGKGGAGNQHFATPTRQIPRFAKPGKVGESYAIQLELKLIADVGLLGFPNVGKSTIISCISAAKPKIASYPFTTLSPVLGVVRVSDEASFVCADIPGIIKGASDGVGLGHAFLRHVERCRLLLHVVDVSGSEGRDPKVDFDTLNAELARYSSILSGRPQIVFANKCDIATKEQIEDFSEFIKAKGLDIFCGSAATMQGVKELCPVLFERLKELPIVELDLPMYVKPEPVQDRAFTIEAPEQGVFIIEAPWLVRILEGSNVDDYESLQFFQKQLQDSGILEKLVEMGVQEKDTIVIDEFEFDYIF